LKTQHYGSLDGHIDLIPKPVRDRIPMLVVGRARQELTWIAENSDGWIWHLSDFNRLPELLSIWRTAAQTVGAGFRPYGYGAFFDLDTNPNTPLLRVGNGIRIGRTALIELWERQRDEGVNHVAMNLIPSRRPAEEVLAELAEFVLPHFDNA
jgi:luciferase-type oxidoreductase